MLKKNIFDYLLITNVSKQKWFEQLIFTEVTTSYPPKKYFSYFVKIKFYLFVKLNNLINDYLTTSLSRGPGN